MKKEKKLRLPRSHYKKHPLVVGMEAVMERDGVSLRSIAMNTLGVTQQTLFDWVEAARKDRNFQLPPRRVPDISRITGIAPYHFNPTLWPYANWKF